MYRFSTQFASAAATTRWFARCIGGSMPLEKTKEAYIAKRKMNKSFQHLFETSEAITQDYQSKLADYQRMHPEANLKEVTPSELQVAWNEQKKQQKEIAETNLDLAFEQKEYLALQLAVENIIKNIYEMFEKKNKGEKFDPKEPFPADGDFAEIQQFEADLEGATKDNDKKKDKE